MSRQRFIDDVARGLKDKVETVKGSMDLSPKMMPAFMLGMNAAADVILGLTDGKATSNAPYRIFPVEYVAVPAEEPITYYDYDRGIGRSGETNDLLKEIWDRVSS